MNKNIGFKEKIEEIIGILNQNCILLIPTDTIYGLICKAPSIQAIRNLYLIKQREINKVFSIFINPNDIEKYCQYGSRNYKLFKHFTPGPITFIIKNTNPELIHVELNGKIGVRIPKTKQLLELLKIYNKPLAATSVNISGEKPATCFEKVDKNILNNPLVYSKDLNYYFNSDSQSQASSIFDISEEKIKVMREGPISISDINNFLLSL